MTGSLEGPGGSGRDDRLRNRPRRASTPRARVKGTKTETKAMPARVTRGELGGMSGGMSVLFLYSTSSHTGCQSEASAEQVRWKRTTIGWRMARRVGHQARTDQIESSIRILRVSGERSLSVG